MYLEAFLASQGNLEHIVHRVRKQRRAFSEEREDEINSASDRDDPAKSSRNSTNKRYLSYHKESFNPNMNIKCFHSKFKEIRPKCKL
jgi:hypothetical protein